MARDCSLNCISTRIFYFLSLITFQYVPHVKIQANDSIGDRRSKVRCSIFVTIYMSLCTIILGFVINLFPTLLFTIDWSSCPINYYNICYTFQFHSSDPGSSKVPTIVLRSEDDHDGNYLDREDTRRAIQPFNDLAKFTLLSICFSTFVSYGIFIIALIRHYYKNHIYYAFNCRKICKTNHGKIPGKDKVSILHPFNDDLEDKKAHTQLNCNKHWCFFLFLGINIVCWATMFIFFFTLQYYYPKAKNNEGSINGVVNQKYETASTKINKILEITSAVLYFYSHLCTIISCFIFSKIMYGIQRKINEQEQNSNETIISNDRGDIDGRVNRVESITNGSINSNVVSQNDRTINDGSQTITNGNNTINGGNHKINGGRNTITGGTTSIYGGINTISNDNGGDGGTNYIYGGSNTVKSGINSIYGGTNNISGSNTNITDYTNTEAKTFNQGSKSIKNGINIINGGTHTIEGGLNIINGGKHTITGGLNTIYGGTNTIEGGLNTINGGEYTIIDGINSLSDSVKLKELIKADETFLECATKTLSIFQLWFFIHWIFYIITSFLMIALSIEAILLHIRATQHHIQPGVHFSGYEISLLIIWSISNVLMFIYPCFQAASITRARKKYIRHLIRDYATNSDQKELVDSYVKYLQSREFGFRLYVGCTHIPFNLNVAYTSTLIGVFGIVLSVLTSVAT